eukprot:TRINITY_DN2212_c0_g1_i1.p1 TRINITY_DN2212_c0_g1~~TRINITY_DN2212_c0_g1_i1.p1  ORF type:complete len:284 (-),score=40.44 TRINITY_DN2212_c0_g1_i1:65-916(-)
MSDVILKCGPYNNTQKILIVGDGNFSFSLSVGSELNLGANLVATSYDSEDVLFSKYPEAKDNLDYLKGLGVIVLHDVDATDLESTLKLPNRDGASSIDFDRIVFQFPLVQPNSSREDHNGDSNDVIRNRRLIHMFLDSASKFLKSDGEIHVTSKELSQYAWWEIHRMAIGTNDIYYDSKFDFDCLSFPKYQVRNIRQKKQFPTQGSKTFVFKKINQKNDNFDTDQHTHTPHQQRRFLVSCAACKIPMTSLESFDSHIVTKSHIAKSKIEEYWRLELQRIHQKN